jgi:hypothetical protein
VKTNHITPSAPSVASATMMGRANRRPVQPATSAIEPRPQPLPMLTVLTVLTQNPQFILGNLRVGNLLARLRAGAGSPRACQKLVAHPYCG